MKPQKEEPRRIEKRRDLGRILRTQRKGKDLTLEQVSAALEARGYSLSASQLSRIENGEVPPNADDLTELGELLGLSWADYGKSTEQPWFLVRAKKARQRLKEVASGKRKIKRSDRAHRVMMSDGFYKYVPLEDKRDYVIPGESAKDTRMDVSQMQKYFFQIEGANEEQVIAGLDRHEGEEIIFVIEGELQFWFKQEESKSARHITLKKGDCLHYKSQLLHGYRATGTSPVEALFVYSNIEPITTPEITDVPPKRSTEQTNNESED